MFTVKLNVRSAHGAQARCRQRRRLRLGTLQPVPTPARCKARQTSPTSSRLMGENTALVAVLVAFSKNAIANRMAAIMASIQTPSRCQATEVQVRVCYVLGVGAGHLIFGFTPI